MSSNSSGARVCELYLLSLNFNQVTSHKEVYSYSVVFCFALRRIFREIGLKSSPLLMAHSILYLFL